MSVRIWIDGTPNPFQLPEPSAWWQKIVFDYDKMLRIFPSQKDRCYRLGRVARREAQLGVALVGEVHQHPDTVTMIRHGLLPISTVFPWAIHSNKILRDLKNRDPWADPELAKDPDKTVARLYAQEQAREQKTDAEFQDKLNYTNGEAFRHMKTLLGEQIVVSETLRGRRGKTATTDKTRVKVALGGVREVPSTRQHARGVPSGKMPVSPTGIVLTDRR